MKRAKRKLAGMNFLLVLVMTAVTLIGRSEVSQAAVQRTQQEAVSWANSQIGKGLDYDKVYGNQCVDLIKYYYAYFGVASYAKGNANAYANNALPAGWKRVYGNYQAGDIAVWRTNHKCGTCTTGSYGHVGIIVSADSVGANIVNQNFNNKPYCTQNWFRCSALQCAIRPNFSAGAADVEFVNQKVSGVNKTNAQVNVRIMNCKRHVTSVGCSLYDANGTLLKTYDENCNYKTNYVNFSCNIKDEMKYTLKSNTQYKYVMYAVVDGQTYKDKMRSFQTAS